MSGQQAGERADAPWPTRADVEDFLYAEAALLDAWRLDEWLELLDEDAHYVVPNTDYPQADEDVDLVLITDDINRLRARVKRLNNRRAHREFPHSRTRRLISNVRIVRRDGDLLDVEASFVVYRMRSGQAAPYVAVYRYTLRAVATEHTIRIADRRAELDNETLFPHGTVSIIL